MNNKEILKKFIREALNQLDQETKMPGKFTGFVTDEPLSPEDEMRLGGDTGEEFGEDDE